MAENNSKSNVVLLRGAKLSRREANRVGLALIMADIGLLFSLSLGTLLSVIRYSSENRASAVPGKSCNKKTF